MTFNLADLFLNLAELCSSWITFSWILYLNTFNLAEHYTENVLT